MPTYYRTVVAMFAIAVLSSCAEYTDPGSSDTETAHQGIIDGQLDGEAHPYVGLALYGDINPDGSVSLLWRCSGALISPGRFLTAGHCGYDAGHVPDIAIIWFGGDLTSVLDGLIAGALEPGFVVGTPVSHPAYDDFAGFPNTHDVGIVELWWPVPMPRYAQLGGPGALDEYMASARGRASLEAVGYGLQGVGVGPFPSSENWTRGLALQHIATTASAYSRGYNVQVNSSRRSIPDGWFDNPAYVPPAGGGTCFGDSGGPQLIPGTDTVVAVTSFGLTETCVGPGFHYRTDRDEVLAFVASPFGN